MKKFHSKSALIAVGIFMVLGLAGSLAALAAATQVDLGDADAFAVLAASSIVDTTPSNVATGDVGLSPTTGAAIGIPNSEVGAGTIYDVDGAGPAGSVMDPARLTSAKGDLASAFTDANQPTDFVISADLGGQTLIPGVYDDNDAPDSLSIAVGTTLTLDAQGDSNAVFIFKTGSTLVTGAGSSVELINGAQACNVFWQVGSSATLGTTTDFKGNLMAAVSITDNGGSTVEGRLLADADNAGGGSVTLNNTTVTLPTCTGTITVTKVVVNDNGGTAVVADFPLFVNAGAVVSGVANTFLAPDSYTVTETGNVNYTQSFAGACDVNGDISLDAHATALCVVTNDDIAVVPPPPGGGGGGSSSPPVPPLIDVVKVPSPLALPGGPGPVTYTYTLTNVGTVQVNSITMVDDSCSSVTLVSGDTDGDARLDQSEVWTYTCSTTLQATHTNNVTATGEANGITAVDVATATVVVGAPVVPPLIHVTKIPNPLVLPVGGGFVTYTERITNPGTVALSNVQLTDDKCGPVTRISGDTDGDFLLDVTETWTYTCRTNLARTTTNVATATGEANGITATDFAIATVVVTTGALVPGLPSAGLPPEAGIPWALVIAGALVLTGTPLVLRLRRSAI